MAYKWFIIGGPQDKIESGWDYKEDAKDRLDEMKEGGIRGFKVSSRATVKRKGLDLTIDSPDWIKGSIAKFKRSLTGGEAERYAKYPGELDADIDEAFYYTPEDPEIEALRAAESPEEFKEAKKAFATTEPKLTEKSLKEIGESNATMAIEGFGSTDYYDPIGSFQDNIYDTINERGGSREDADVAADYFTEYLKNSDYRWSGLPKSEVLAKLRKLRYHTLWDYLDRQLEAEEKAKRGQALAYGTDIPIAELDALAPEWAEEYEKDEWGKIYENWEWVTEDAQPRFGYGEGIFHHVPNFGRFSIEERAIEVPGQPARYPGRKRFIVIHEGEELGSYDSKQEALEELGIYVKSIGANPGMMNGNGNGKVPWGWIVGGLGLFAIWWAMRDSGTAKPVKEPKAVAPAKPEAKAYSGPFHRKPTEEDERYLAKVIIKEAGNKGPGLEWAGIGWVAVNRANRRKKSIKDVVAVLSWPGGGSRGRAFVADIKTDNPLWHARGPAALEIAESLLRGEIPNPIGKREHFVHARGLKKTTKKDGTPIKDKWIAVGGRALPVWIVSKELGGKAKYPPMKIQQAIFA